MFEYTILCINLHYKCIFIQNGKEKPTYNHQRNYIIRRYNQSGYASQCFDKQRV